LAAVQVAVRDLKVLLVALVQVTKDTLAVLAI
jgi:hypothetical protein